MKTYLITVTKNGVTSTHSIEADYSIDAINEVIDDLDWIAFTSNLTITGSINICSKCGKMI